MVAVIGVGGLETSDRDLLKMKEGLRIVVGRTGSFVTSARDLEGVGKVIDSIEDIKGLAIA